MAKHALSFIELHSQLFHQGSNLGNKINAAQKGVILFLDDERQGVWLWFKLKLSFIPLPNVASMDMKDIPQDIQDVLGLGVPEELSGPPALAKARRGRPPKEEPAEPISSAPEPVPFPTHDPNDPIAAAAHRAKVRAASANAYRPVDKVAQNDLLIQEARAHAQGVKLQKTAQVQNAHQVGQTTSVTGKSKPLSYAALQAQVEAESKS